MADVLVSGLDFAEGPRWHQGKLWFSDFYRKVVSTVDLDGHVEPVVEVPGQPSGLGWMPDGRLAIVSMRDRKVYLLDEQGALHEHADLSAVAAFHANDMLVDATGGAWVGNFGFDLHALLEKHEVPEAVGLVHADPASHVTRLARVEPDGAVRAVGEPMLFPNGMVLRDAGRTLVVSETVAFRLVAYEVGERGELGAMRVWADLQQYGAAPDGLCAGPDGTILVAPALAPEVLAVAEGGEVVARHAFSQNVFAVASDGHHLFAMTAPSSEPRFVDGKGLGRIEVAELRA